MTLLSSSASCTRRGRATAMHATRTPAAASAEKRTMSNISGQRSHRRRTRIEDCAGQGLATLGEVLHVHRAVSGRAVESLDVAVFVDAGLAKLEQLMRLRLA